MSRLNHEKYDALERLGFQGRLLQRELGFWKNIPSVLDGYTYVRVSSKEDLTGDLQSDKCYFIDGFIDMEDTSIVVPETGLTIKGCGFSTSKLYTSNSNATIFVDNGNYSGDLFLENLTISNTGTNSKTFNLNNSGNLNTVECNGINFQDCVSLGSLDSYRQLLTRNVGFINIDDGLEFIGTWAGGLTIVDTILLFIPSNVTVFKAGSGFTINGSIRSNMNAINIDDTSTVFDFTSSNISPDGGFFLDGFRTSFTSNAIPNVSSGDVKVRFKNCTGIRNTYVGGSYSISSETSTTIPSINTLVKLAGTTAYTDLQWFSGTSNNSFTYLSSQPIEVVMQGVLSFSGTNNNVIGLQIRKWDNLASSYTNVGGIFKATLNSVGKAENLAFQGITSIKENDRLEVWIENETSTASVTGLLGGSVTILERNS